VRWNSRLRCRSNNFRGELAVNRGSTDHALLIYPVLGGCLKQWIAQCSNPSGALLDMVAPDWRGPPLSSLVAKQ
jgi:hypothetical protein